MPYLWAAYQKGMWPEFFDSDLPQGIFQQKAYEMMLQPWVSKEWVVDTRGDRGNRPSGLILGRSFGPAMRYMEPHVDWFPWATTRNKVEGVAAIIDVLSKHWKIMAFVKESDTEVFELMRQARLIRRGCKMFDHFADGEHAMMYYT